MRYCTRGLCEHRQNWLKKMSLSNMCQYRTWLFGLTLKPAKLSCPIHVSKYLSIQVSSRYQATVYSHYWDENMALCGFLSLTCELWGAWLVIENFHFCISDLLFAHFIYSFITLWRSSALCSKVTTDSRPLSSRGVKICFVLFCPCVS